MTEVLDGTLPTVIPICTAPLIVRSLRGNPKSYNLPVPAGVSLIVIAISITSSLLTTISAPHSAAWTTAFSLTVLVPILFIRLSPEEANSIVKMWMLLAVIGALYGILEWLLSANPIYGTFYAVEGQTGGWAAYRIRTSLGHPLNNMIFYSISFAFFLGRALASPSRKLWFGTLLTFIAVTLTVSRTGLLVCGIISILGVFFTRNPKGTESQTSLFLTKLIGSVALALAVVIGSRTEAFDARNNSWDGQQSTMDRFSIFSVAETLMSERPVSGWGPGTSGITGEITNSVLLIENSYIQIGISLGIFGLAGFTLFFGYLAIRSFKKFRSEYFLPLAALLIAIAGLNWIEARHSLIYLSLISLLVLRDTQNDEDASSVDSTAGTSLRLRV